MKKILSSILAASVIAASSCLPAMADYSEGSYDLPRQNINYNDDGDVVNDIDETNAKKFPYVGNDPHNILFEFESDGGTCGVFSSEFFLSFDFRFDSAEDGSVNGEFGIDRRDNDSNRNFKQGPRFSYDAEKGMLRNQTGGDKYEDIAAISPDVWYTMELEGKMSVADAAVTLRLYGYDEGEKTLIEEKKGLNLRQFYAGAKNGNPNYMQADGVSMDNIVLISEYPDEIVITGQADEVSAGQSLPLDYTMQRLGNVMTKYPVTWSVYDETGEEVTDGSVTIDDAGILTADITAPDMTVTVKADAEFNETPLTGEKQITVNAVDTTDEKFDTISISGDADVKAGSETEYTVTASKQGEDVTDTLGDGDVVWSIYDYQNISEIYDTESAKVRVENGVLTVDGDVLPQTVTLRAGTPSGAVYGTLAVNIGYPDGAPETVYYSNAFDSAETAPSGTDKGKSVDGSTALLPSADTGFAFGNQSGNILTEMDIKFANEGSGFVIKRNDDQKTNTEITYQGGSLKTHGGSVMSGVSTDKWYHVEIVYYAQKNAACNIWEYDENGVIAKDTKMTVFDLDRRNDEPYGLIQILGGTCVDNIKVSAPVANEIEITSSQSNVFAGGTVQYSAAASRNGLTLLDAEGIVWSVLDSEGLPVIDGTVTISETGLLTVGSMVQPQTFTVKAETAGGASDTAEITVQSADIFKVKGLGKNEDGTKIVRMYVDKAFYYDDDVTFIIAVKDSEGVLKALEMVETFGSRYSIGENEVTTDLDLQADFDPESDVIETMIWTKF